MNITALGPLRPHPRIRSWLISNPIPIPYFDGKTLTVTLDGLESSDEAATNSAIDNFLKLSSKDRLAATRYVFMTYQHAAERVTKEDLGCEIKSEEEVWDHVKTSEIFIMRRAYGDRAIYVLITAECDWEPEHGLQPVYRRGNELCRVSEQDGHLTHTDAYAIPEDQDQIA